MKRTFMSFILGMCCAVSMAQPLDSAKIVSDWNRLTAYCCAQYELDYLNSIPDSTKYNDARKELSRYTFIASKKFSHNYVSDSISKKYFLDNKEVQDIASHFAALDTVPDKFKYWDSLFCQFNINDYSSKAKSDELRALLTKEYQFIAHESDSGSMALSKMELIIIAGLGVLLLLVLYLLFRISSCRKEIETLHVRVRDISSSLSSHRSSVSVEKGDKAAIEKLQNKIASLESQLHAINEKMHGTREEENRRQVNSQTSGANFGNGYRQSPLGTSVPTSASIYLKSFNAGIMRECNAADAQYRLTPLNSESTRGEFVFVGDAASAIATKDATFEDICDLENWSMSAKSCTTIEKGQAEKVSDGKWKVSHKGRVKFS